MYSRDRETDAITPPRLRAHLQKYMLFSVSQVPINLSISAVMNEHYAAVRLQ
jgi:hypothetical protein